MKYPILITVLALLPVWPAMAQDRIYRCPGNEYTNNAADAKARGCKVMEGGNVTIVQGTRPGGGGASAPAVRSTGSGSGAGSPAGAPKVDSGEQRARDSDARAILESELKKAEARLAELKQEYNNGQPERRGDERNYQKYLDRVEELRAGIARTESDIAGIRRELGRAPGASGAASGAK